MKKISIQELKPGMTLARTIINDNLIVVLAENTMISAAHITRLQFLGIDEVYIKDAYDMSPQQSIVQSMLNRSHSFASKYKEVLSLAEDIFSSTVKDKQIPVSKTQAFVHTSLVPLSQNCGVIDYLYELKHVNNSIYNHSMRVSILSGVLAKWLRYNEKKTKDIVLAGFLHDIGKTQIAKDIAEKNAERLTPEEREIYIQHTVAGYHLLSEKGELSEGVKSTPLQHHERMDGSGFPFNSRNEEIHDYAKIVAIADLYDNITTEKEGFVKQTPFSAIEKITKEMFSSLDPKFCVPFLLNVQQSFLGSVILLSDKSRGRIIHYPKDFAALPFIKLETGEAVDLNKRLDLKIIEYNPS